MVEYNKLENETTNLIDSETSSLVDKHFQGISDLLEELEIPDDSRVRTLFELNEVSTALKYLLKNTEGKLGINGDHINSEGNISIDNLYNIIKFFNKEECKCLNDVLKQYREKVKEHSSDSVKVFEKIKLFFQDIIAKFKGKSFEDFDDEHTLNTGNSKFYCDTVTQTKPKQESHPEEVLEQKADRSPILETIVEEDEDIYVDNVAEVISKVKNNKGLVSHKEISIPVTQFAQEKTLPKPQVAQIEEKPAKPTVPPESQEVIDAENRIRGKYNQKTEIYTSSMTVNLKPVGEKPQIAPKPQKVIDVGNKIREERNQKTEIYTSIMTVSLKPADEKPQIAPKPTIKICSQAEKQYGQNVADKKQFFESLNTNPKTKVKGKVERLVEKFEAKNQGVA